MADFFPKVEATQYRGSVGLPEGRLDEFLVDFRRNLPLNAEFAGCALRSRWESIVALILPLKHARYHRLLACVKMDPCLLGQNPRFV
jgi:hypothetical protein